MADKEAAAEDDKQAQEDFAAAFAEDDSRPVDVKPEEAKEVKAEEAEAKAPEVPEEKKDEAPAIVQLTKAEYDLLMGSLPRVQSHETWLNSLSGKFGHVKSSLEKLQAQIAATPDDEPIVIDPEHFAELKEEFPDVAEKTRKGFERALNASRSRKKAAGEAKPAAERIEPDTAQPEFVSKEDYAKRETEALTDAYPQWREIVGAQDDTNNRFRRWLATRPPEYREMVNQTYSSRVVERALDRFYDDERKAEAEREKAERETASQAGRRTSETRAAEQRQDRIASAVQPRGDGRPPMPATRTAHDDFRDGFNSE